MIRRDARSCVDTGLIFVETIHELSLQGYHVENHMFFFENQGEMAYNKEDFADTNTSQRCFVETIHELSATVWNFSYRMPLRSMTLKANLLQQRRRSLLVILMVASIVFLDLFLWQMFRSLHGPFRLMLAQSEANEQIAGRLPTQAEIVAQMQGQDTDSDGLSDYEEVYVYQTSSYLDDSDSDGVGDKQEVDAGENPNCPKGKDCASKPVEGGTVAEKPTQFTQDAADALRYALVQAGMKKEDLEKFTDEELLKMYREAVSSQPDQAPAQESLSPDQLLYFEQLGPNEIRELLIKAGVDESLIKTIPDGRLKEMYLETLGEVKP